MLLLLLLPRLGADSPAATRSGRMPTSPVVAASQATAPHRTMAAYPTLEIERLMVVNGLQLHFFFHKDF